jgi:HK97 family phage major capsid protein
MKQSTTQKALRAKKVETLESLVAVCEMESRAFSEDESKQVDALNADIAELDGKIERSESTENNIARMANVNGTPAVDKEVTKAKEIYSLSRAISGAMGSGLTGVEAEVHQEAQREARSAGIQLAGNVAIPQSMFRSLGDPGELSAVSGDGSDFVPTEHQDFIAALQPRLLIEELGAHSITGVTGNLDIPRVSAAGVAQWASSEAAASVDSNMATDVVQMSPKRIGAFTTYTKQLLTQGVPSVDRIIAEDLGRSIRNAVDYAAFNGSGSSGIPEGVFNASGTNAQAATNGTAITAANVVKMITDCAAENGLTGNEKFVVSPAVYAKLSTLAQVASVSPLMVNDTIQGYAVEMTSHLLQGVTKGSSTSNTGQLLFGDFSNILVCRWTGQDLLIDPYTLGGSSQVKVIANQWLDVALRNPLHFARIDDGIHS